jgi:opacity protein-like surface antigen
MHMNIRSITIAGAVLVLSTAAGFAQDWTKEPQDWTKNPQVQTQSPVTQAQTPQNNQPQTPQDSQPQITQNPTTPPPAESQPPPTEYQAEEYPTEGSADWTQKIYTHVDFGGSYQQSTTLFQSAPAPTTKTATFNLGMRGNLAVGYHFNESWAAEFDTGLIWNSVDKANGVSLDQPYPNNASFTTYTVPVLVNVVYKVPLKGDLIPYAAAGFGGAATILSYNKAASGFTGSDFVFAYQVEVGLKYRVTPNASFGIAYQFLGMTDPSWHSVLVVGASPPTNYQFKESGFYTHSLAITFTWDF